MARARAPTVAAPPPAAAEATAAEAVEVEAEAAEAEAAPAEVTMAEAAPAEIGCPQDPKENSFPTQKGTHEANLMLASSNRSEASSVGGPSSSDCHLVGNARVSIVTRSSASVTLHLAPSGRGTDLVQADPH